MQKTTRAPGRTGHEFYEFFAGAGMARAGLGDRWVCRFANDFDPKKAASYAANWGDDHLTVGNVADVTAADLPGIADLVWASFPCQDLSLAGKRAGLRGARSGMFWTFWRLMTSLSRVDRMPRLIVLENVCGALTSRDGKDFAAIGGVLAMGNYRFGAVVINAAHFVPQSRPRLFIIAVHTSITVPRDLLAEDSNSRWHPPALIKAHAKLSAAARKAWLWWRLAAPPLRNASFADLIEDTPNGVGWHTPETTRHLLSMMSKAHRAKVAAARKTGRRAVGGLYKRTRVDAAGAKVQRAEVRFDEIAGCLRTPAGGSSRQSIMIVEGDRVRSRLLSPREAARLMGLPENYKLPQNYNEAYRLASDGVVVPVVSFIATHILEPILACERKHWLSRLDEAGL